MILLSADWHLTDRPHDEYRWTAFSAAERLCAKHKVKDFYILGDLADKKDRHAGAFVNRVVDSLCSLASGSRVTAIMGNHDEPQRGVPVWNVINRTLENVRFFTQPHIEDGRAFLPFTPHPDEAWTNIDFKSLKALFLHQPVDGAKVGKAVIKGSAMPRFPRGLKIYGGDIHVPQIAGRVHYVGAPHHIDFGDDYKCRMLVIDPNTFEIMAEELLTPPGKELIEIGSIDEIDRYDLQAGDQIKVRLSLDPTKLKDYATQERKLAEWAKEAGVHITGLETRVIEPAGQSVDLRNIANTDAAFASWIEREGLDADRVDAGRRLLDRALGK